MKLTPGLALDIISSKDGWCVFSGHGPIENDLGHGPHTPAHLSAIMVENKDTVITQNPADLLAGIKSDMVTVVAHKRKPVKKGKGSHKSSKSTEHSNSASSKTRSWSGGITDTARATGGCHLDKSDSHTNYRMLNNPLTLIRC